MDVEGKARSPKIASQKQRTVAYVSKDFSFGLSYAIALLCAFIISPSFGIYALGTEVYQHTEWAVGQPEIRPQLSSLNLTNSIQGFEFNYDIPELSVCHNKVKASFNL